MATKGTIAADQEEKPAWERQATALAAAEVAITGTTGLWREVGTGARHGWDLDPASSRSRDRTLARTVKVVEADHWGLCVWPGERQAVEMEGGPYCHLFWR